MGHVNTILSAILCAVAPLTSTKAAPNFESEQMQSVAESGKETIAAIRAAYEKGEYGEFLNEMDVAYQDTDLDGLIQMRKQQIPGNFEDKWEKRFLELQKEKNRELLSVLSDRDDSIFAQKVRSVAANLSMPEQEKAISKLNSFIAMAPNTGANDDENKLIDLDLEYEFKLLHAQLPSEETSPQKRREQQIALRMEKMDRMVEMSKSFQDHSLKQAISLAAANFDARLARNLDGADLNALVKGKAKPSNALEEKVYAILSSYQGQFSDLMKGVLSENGI